MPRVRERKTSRGQIDLSQYKDAYEEVKAGVSLRNAAKKHGVNHMSLLRYTRKRNSCADEENQDMGYKAHNRVFTEEQERELSKQLIQCADYSLSKKDIRKLAYELTLKYNLLRPRTWDDNKIAGEEWVRLFMRRNPELSTKIVQAKNFSKTTSFNKSNVDAFYDSLGTIMDNYKFEPQDIYNTDEIGITTVLTLDRVMTKYNARQEDSLPSASVVSVAFAANAIGNLIPPFFVFPQVHYEDHFIRDGPVGASGTSNPSGWIQDEALIPFLNHFKKYTYVSPTHKVLLVLDNDSFDIHTHALDFCRDNGIVLLTFPPKCSHRLQPLNRSVFGPLKKAVNSTCDAWMRNHPRKTMTIYDIPGIVASAMPLALTLSTTQAGFRKTGIYPYNRHVFTELDFTSSLVGDRSTTENTTKAEVVMISNIPSEDKTPSFSSSNDPLVEIVVQQENINDSPIVKIEEDKFTDGKETLSAYINHDISTQQQNSPKPCTSAQPVPFSYSFAITPKDIEPSFKMESEDI